MKKITIFLFIIYFSLQTTLAQDLHWSLIQLNPMYANPANTGFVEQNKLNRFVMLYRDQWRTIPVSYSTPYISYDRNLFQKNNNQIGIGAQMFYDRSSEGNLSMFKPSISFAYGRMIGTKHRLQLGLQGAYALKQLRFDKLTFENQYNGVDFDPNLPSREQLDGEKDGYFDLGTGINYHLELLPRRYLDAGVGIFNITNPSYNFLTEKDIPVHARIHAYTKAKWQIKDSRWAVAPAAFFQLQNKAQELLIQGLGEVRVGNKTSKPTYVSFGAGYRTLDAMIAYAGVNWSNLQISASYDINLSDIDMATNNKGGYELALNYIWGDRKVPEKPIEIVETKEETKVEEEEIYSLPNPPPLLPTPLTVQEVRQIDTDLKSVLPVYLYFDIDQPDPKSTSDTTNKIYNELYSGYKFRQDVFEQKGGEGTNDFFDNKLDKGQFTLDNALFSHSLIIY